MIRSILPAFAVLALFATTHGVAHARPDAGPRVVAEHDGIEPGAQHVSPLLAEVGPAAAPETGTERGPGHAAADAERRLRPVPAHDRSSRLGSDAPARGRHPGFLAHPSTAPPHEA